MSNIPKARQILQDAIDNGDSQDAATTMFYAIREALALLDRRKPEFVARRVVKALSWRQKMKVRELRATGMSLHDIAVRMGTNIGRVSEAINEEV